MSTNTSALSILLTSVSNNIQPRWLSPMLLSQIPVKHLLEQARSRRQDFRGLYAPLLQLINSHLPHLCLVDDWLRQEEVFTVPLSRGSPLPGVKCSPSRLQEGKCHKTCEGWPTWVFFLLSYKIWITLKQHRWKWVLLHPQRFTDKREIITYWKMEVIFIMFLI